MENVESERKNDTAEEVAATDVRGRLTELMNRAAYNGARFIVTVHGKPSGAIVGVKDLERLRALDAAEVG